VTSVDVEESWKEDDVTVKYKKYRELADRTGIRFTRIDEEGAGEGLRFVIKKYKMESDRQGHLEEVVTFDWTPSTGHRVSRLKEFYVAAGWKLRERRYDAEKCLTDLIYYNSRGQVIVRSQFENGCGKFVHCDESGDIWEFGCYTNEKKDGTVYRKFEGKVFRQEWCDGKKVSSETLGARLWPELLRDHGIR
jgi:hypothetical protein